VRRALLLRWTDINEQRQYLTVRPAVFMRSFSAPKTAPGSSDSLSEEGVKLWADENLG
jgi:hypothetical protein